MANSGLGVPVKLLHESLGHIITVELKTGQLYRGKLAEAEDNLNISLKDITVTGRDGRVSQLDQVYIRGSMVRFFIVPDMLQNAPMQVQTSRPKCNAGTGNWYGTWTRYYHAGKCSAWTWCCTDNSVAGHKTMKKS
ncbi:Small nuclear ribonucleoprotein Sm D3 [Mycena sanguinolenta]|uniref:Small nuclear ribonucleoprotein Sm D3 n=1 Tax=Mycena sanguinolenta TaxID=230812 RepID=A0A8H6ZIJ9_9AGAR|nr:Small nuclear ribonucleoprotein Sm D3 [Mycena sanguinolenta]